jgi:hypothetical protein
MQAPLQCTVVLHAPLQTGSRSVGVRSCRAETVPAQRTPMTSAVKNIDLIFFMIAFFLVPGPNDGPAILLAWLQ